MWFEEAVVYQIYPLGLCGAPLQNDGVHGTPDFAAAGLGGAYQEAGGGRVCF